MYFLKLSIRGSHRSVVPNEFSPPKGIKGVCDPQVKRFMNYWDGSMYLNREILTNYFL